jgi:hypothetical protein
LALIIIDPFHGGAVPPRIRNKTKATHAVGRAQSVSGRQIGVELEELACMCAVGRRTRRLSRPGDAAP